MLSVVTNEQTAPELRMEQTAPELRMDLDELAREGARRMLAKPSRTPALSNRSLNGGAREAASEVRRARLA